MPYKDPEKQREFQQRRYQETYKAKFVARNREQRQLRHDVINDLKEKRGCDRCGYNSCVVALEFHHLGQKNFAISEGVSSCKNIDDILSECELCELVCANCHREIHHIQKGYVLNKPEPSRHIIAAGIQQAYGEVYDKSTEQFDGYDVAHHANLDAQDTMVRSEMIAFGQRLGNKAYCPGGMELPTFMV